MKTKIARRFFTAVLLLALNFGTDIGGPTLPPKPPTGPAYQVAYAAGAFVTAPQES